MADATEVQDSQPVEETVVEETVVESEPTAEELATLNKQLFERAKKAETELKELKKKPKETNQQPSQSQEEIERLRLEVKGYKDDEVDFLMQNGGMKALDNPIVLAGIDAVRKKAKSQEATPSGTNKSPVYQRFTERDLQKMSAEELEKILPQ